MQLAAFLHDPYRKSVYLEDFLYIMGISEYLHIRIDAEYIEDKICAYMETELARPLSPSRWGSLFPFLRLRVIPF